MRKSNVPRSQTRFHLHLLASVCLAIPGLACCGCGGDDTTRFDVSGTVTYDGQPVPAGRILFQPDATAGNKGVAGYALIRDGKFNTATDGNGTIGGPHVVVISGYEGQGDPDLPLGRPLFQDYRVTVELPYESSTQNFDVPVSKPGA